MVELQVATAGKSGSICSMLTWMTIGTKNVHETVILDEMFLKAWMKILKLNLKMLLNKF